MVNKVNAFLVFDTDQAGSTASPSVHNVQLLNHTLTVADMSTPVDQLPSTFNCGTWLADNAVTLRDYHNYGWNVDGSTNPCTQVRLQLNGHDRFAARDGAYFNYVQPYQHFTNTPCDGLNVYSFALEPEKHQPSGTCNFSRIDNTTLSVDMTGSSGDWTNSSSVMNIYAMNYNVLRVMSGMAGVAY